MIYLSATGQLLKVVGNPHIVADTYNHLACDIRFSGEWRELHAYARFTAPNGNILVREVVNGRLEKDAGLNFTEGTWLLMLHGDEYVSGELTERITTNEIRLEVKKSGFHDGTEWDIDIDAGTQIIAQCVEQADKAEAAADRAETAAGAAEAAAEAAVEDVTDAVNTAIASANAAAASANEKGIIAYNRGLTAKNAADAANAAAKSANDAATLANAARANTIKATTLAQTATENANKATREAGTAATAAYAAADAANTAADNATAAETSARNASSNANNAAASANSAAQYAHDEGSDANLAAENAYAALTEMEQEIEDSRAATAAASSAASNANIAKNSAELAADNANTRATEALNAAEAANAAAEGITGHTGNTTIHITAEERAAWNAKQDDIADIDAIRSGAASGATALQSVPVATNTAVGLIKGGAFGAKISNSALYPEPVSLATYSNWSNYNFIAKGTLENIKEDYVKRALKSDAMSFDDNEKSEACGNIGAATQTSFTSVITLLGQVKTALEGGNTQQAVNLLDTFIIGQGVLSE